MLRCSWLASAWFLQVPEPRYTIVGYSTEERAVEVFSLGHGPHSVLILGGTHGGSESNTSWLVWELLTYFVGQPQAVPALLTLHFVPAVNPDGISNASRELASGVDPNRNWPTADWTPDTFAPGAVLRYGGGGAYPMSEPETIALATWFDHVQPVAVISYHSAAGMVMGGSLAYETGLLQAYLAATAYRWYDWVAYPVTGDFAQWSEALGVPTIEVELTDHVEPEIDRNLAGVLAVLDTLAAILAVILGPYLCFPDFD